MAIYVIALHTILFGIATPLASTSEADPFTVICHSAGQAAVPGDQSPADRTPASACDHCNLCGASAAPSDTLDSVIAGRLTPAKLLQVLRPAAGATREDLASNPNRARGPPQFA
jgi:hypothetical protein